MAGVEDGVVQGAGAVKKGGLNLDTRARFGRRGAGITAVTLCGVARPGMAEKKGVTGGTGWSAGRERGTSVWAERERMERAVHGVLLGQSNREGGKGAASCLLGQARPAKR